MRGSLDFGGRADRLIGGQTALGVDQVGSKDRVDEGRFAQTGLTWSLVSAGHGVRGWEHTNTHDIELESALQQLALDLGGDAVETDMAVGEDGGRVGRGGACGSH